MAGNDVSILHGKGQYVKYRKPKPPTVGAKKGRDVQGLDDPNSTSYDVTGEAEPVQGVDYEEEFDDEDHELESRQSYTNL